MLNRFLAFLIIAFSVGTVAPSYAKSAFEYIYERKLIANEYTQLLNGFAKSTNLNRRLSVNTAMASSSIPVVVLKYDQSADYNALLGDLIPSSKAQSSSAEILLNNAFVVSGNTVIIGELYLAHLLISCYNDLMAATQISIEVGSGEATSKHSSNKNNAIASVLRFNNLQYTTRFEDGGKKYEGKSALIAMSRFIAGGLGQNQDEQPEWALVSGCLLPLIAHEMAHIDDGVDVAGLFSFIERWKRERIRTQEDAADVRAIGVVVKYLDKLKRQRDKTWHKLAIIGVSAFASLTRDRLLVLATEDNRFRDLRASDLFVELLHGNCTDDPDLKGLDPLNPKRVLSGRFKSLRDFILLNTRDMSDMKRRLVDDPNNRGHSHEFKRARILLDALGKFESLDVRDDLRTFELLQGALLDGRTKQTFDQTLKTFPIPAIDLEEKLTNWYTFEDAAWCPAERCRIGTPSDRSELGGIVEIVGDSRNTYRLTWYAPIGLGSNDKYPRQMVHMTSFFLAVTGRIEPMTVASQTVRTNRIQCEVGAGLWEDNKLPYFIGMWSLFRPEWIVIQMQSKQVLEE